MGEDRMMTTQSRRAFLRTTVLLSATALLNSARVLRGAIEEVGL